MNFNLWLRLSFTLLVIIFNLSRTDLATAQMNETTTKGYTFGLIGTGKIGTSVMNGYCSENGWQPDHVYVSTRSQAKAASLKQKYPDRISITESNQDIIDKSDVIFIGLLPRIAQDILPQLNFGKTKIVISMMATIPFHELMELVKLPETQVVRTVPLPSTAQRRGPILLYPKNDECFRLLTHIGKPVTFDTEVEIKKMTVMTAMISYFYASCSTLHRWATENGVAEGPSRDFVASFMESLSSSGMDSHESFLDMAEEAATPGGLNEQTHKGLTETHVYERITDQLDQVYQRLAPEDQPATRPSKSD